MGESKRRKDMTVQYTVWHTAMRQHRSRTMQYDAFCGGDRDVLFKAVREKINMTLESGSIVLAIHFVELDITI